MEGEEGATSILAWAKSWFTPSILFLLLNLVIGTIIVTSKGIARAHRHHQQQYNHPEEEHRAPYISRSTSSLLTRLRSIGSLSRYTSGDIPSESTPPPPPETHPDPSEHEGGSVRDHQLGRSQSEAHPKAEETEAAGRMHKSASARSVADVADRRAGTADRAVEEVDARADDFINRFRDQLRLQRLDSILRYRDMLNRGK